MNTLYLLIPMAVAVLVVMVIGFIWTVRNDQYEDLEGPAHRILMDDDDPRIPSPPGEPERPCTADSAEEAGPEPPQR